VVLARALARAAFQAMRWWTVRSSRYCSGGTSGSSGRGVFEGVAAGLVGLVALVVVCVGEVAGEDGFDPGVVVVAVVGECFAGPVAGDEHPSAGEAEGVGLVDFADTPAGDEAGFSFAGLDAVEEPVRAGWRARQDREFGVEAVEVRPGVLAARGGGVGQVFGDVFGDVPDGAFGIFGAAFDAAHFAGVDRP